MKIDGPIGCWFHGAYYPICDVATSDYTYDAEGMHFRMTTTPDPTFPSRLLEHFERDGVPDKIYWTYA